LYCLVGPHILPLQLTDNHYRDFLVQDLPKLLEYPLVEHECGTCMMVLRHILAVLCKAFSEKSIITDEYVEEGLHACQIWILCIFTCGNTWKSLCMQLLLTTKKHLTIALWMPVRLSATPQAPSNGCGGPWWEVSRRALNPMEDTLCTFYFSYKLQIKCFLIPVNMDIFSSLVCGKFAPNLSARFGYTQCSRHHQKLLPRLCYKCV
jgi:hypothetical protein